MFETVTAAQVGKLMFWTGDWSEIVPAHVGGQVMWDDGRTEVTDEFGPVALDTLCLVVNGHVAATVAVGRYVEITRQDADPNVSHETSPDAVELKPVAPPVESAPTPVPVAPVAEVTVAPVEAPPEAPAPESAPEPKPEPVVPTP